MSFMEQQIQQDNWWMIETYSEGTVFIPASFSSREEVRNDYPDAEEVELLEQQYGARLSAPGYMDCTDWCVFETYEEAQKYLDEVYGPDEGWEDEDCGGVLDVTKQRR